MKNQNETLTPEVAMSLAITGRYLDEQVSAGRTVEDVLAEGSKSPGVAIWYDRNALSGFSQSAGAASVA